MTKNKASITKEAVVTVITGVAYTLANQSEFSTMASISIAVSCNLLARLALHTLCPTPKEPIYQPGLFGSNNGFILLETEKNMALYTPYEL